MYKATNAGGVSWNNITCVYDQELGGTPSEITRLLWLM